MNWMVLPLRRYVEFSGRSRRKEYWMFILLTVLVSIAAGIVDVALGFGHGGGFSRPGAFGATATSNGPVGALVSLALLVPSLAVAVRRLHDTNRSAWWLLLALVPIFGWIALFVFYCLDGTRGANRFGPDPKSENLKDVFA